MFLILHVIDTAGSVGFNVVNEFAVRKKRTAGMICLELNLYAVSCVHPSIYLSIYISIYISFYLFLSQSISIYLSVSQSISLSIYLSRTYFSVCVSVMM